MTGNILDLFLLFYYFFFLDTRGRCTTLDDKEMKQLSRKNHGPKAGFTGHDNFSHPSLRLIDQWGQLALLLCLGLAACKLASLLFSHCSVAGRQASPGFHRKNGSSLGHTAPPRSPGPSQYRISQALTV